MSTGMDANRPDGAALIAAERARQVSGEGYDPAHDDEHDHGELVLAAVCYAAPRRVYVQMTTEDRVVFCDPFPWRIEDDKRRRDAHGTPARAETREARIRELVKAGALVAAEIDRLQRGGAW